MKPENEILDPYGTPVDKAAAELLVVRQVKTGTGKRILRTAVVLVVALGQWLIGGDYALSPLCWLLIGTVAAGSTAALTRPTRPPAAGRLAPAGRR